MKELLELSALILSIVNGLALLKYYLNDKPKLSVYPVHPEAYQWWFKLPDGEYEGKPTRKYGFLTYIAINNRGLRKVSLDSWRLKLNTTATKEVELKPISIPEPQGDIGKSGHRKIFPVLGQKGSLSLGETLVDSGTSISGMAYYIAEFYGNESWNPVIIDKKIIGKIVIKDIFGNIAHAKFNFSNVSLEYVKSIIEEIDKIC